MGCPIGTVKSRVRRARDELQSILFDGRQAAAAPSHQPFHDLLGDLEALRHRAHAA